MLKCINHLSTDPHCLEHLQRADAIKHLIPNLDLKDGPLVSQIHHEVSEVLGGYKHMILYAADPNLMHMLICIHMHNLCLLKMN